MINGTQNLYLSFESLRDRITSRLVPFFLVALLLNMIFSLARIPTMGFRPFMLLHVLLFGMITILYIARRRIRPDTTALIMVGFLSLLLLSGVATLGLLSASLVLGPMISLYLMLLGHRKSAYASVVLILAYLSAMAVLHVSGVLESTASPALYVRSSTAWVLVIIAVCGVSVAFVAPFELVPGALEGSEERFRRAFENANVGSCLISLEGHLLKVNDALCEMLGYSREELEQMSISDITHQDDRDASLNFIKHAATGGATEVKLEKRYLHKKGDVIWANAASSLIRDSGHHPQYFIAHIQDITERKQAEEALRKGEERYHLVVDNLKEIVFQTDAQGLWLFLNRAWEEVTGFGVKESIGRLFLDFVHPDDRERNVELFKPLIERKKTYCRHDIRYLTRDGGFRWIEVYARLGLDDQDQVIGTYGSLTDITERKRAELEREAINEINHGVATTANLDELLNLIHGSLQRVLYAENCFVALHDQNTGLFSFPYFVDKLDSVPQPASLSKSCTAYVFRTGKPLLMTSTMFEQLREQNEVELIGSDSPSWMGVPLQTPSRTIGVLVLQHYDKEDVYTEHDLRFLASIGSQVAIVIERKQAEATLRDSESRLSVILESTADGILAVDSKGKVLRTNKRFAELWHIPQSLVDSQDDNAMLNHVLGQLVDPEAFLSKVRSLYGSANEARDTLHFKDGRVFERYSAPFLAGGDSAGRVWSFHDITDHMRAKEALSRSQERYRLLYEYAPVGIILANRSGQILEVNPATLQILGSPSAEMTKGINLLTFPLLLEAGISAAFQRCVETARASFGEYPYVTKWGKSIHMQLRFVPILGDHDQVAMVHIIIEDITERKQAEDALRHAQKLESIGTLAGGIAHDFNNLLNAILGQTSLALGKLAPENSAVSHLTKATKAAEHAADLTRQLLAYSGKGKFVNVEIDLNRLVEENVQMLEVSVPKTAQLRFDLASPSPRIQGDAGQIQQIIMNLIINAGEAMGPNPGYITVRSGQIELTQADTEYWKYSNTPLAPGRYALLQVSDTGHGIKPEVRTRIFDPFFTTKFTGRGLGLAAVLGIIRGHNGGLRIESEGGQGTTFEIVFPMVEPHMKTDARETKDVPVWDGAGRTILAIDDEPSMLDLLTDIFTGANFTVLGALNPIEGIELFRRHQQSITMVILDYSMPEMDGKTAFEELLKINKDARVLLCSGYAEEETASAFGTVRPAGFIQKPYAPAKLLSQVWSLLSDARPG